MLDKILQIPAHKVFGAGKSIKTEIGKNENRKYLMSLMNPEFHFCKAKRVPDMDRSEACVQL